MSSDGSSTVLFGALPPTIKLSAGDKRALTMFTKALSAKIADGQSFNCLITDDRELQYLNQKFRNHNYPTDVLSFPSLDKMLSLGDCAISVERALEQSREYGHSLLAEIQLLMLHGLLHLVGFDHERDAGEMARLEQQWRMEFNLPQSLIQRTQAQEAAAL